MKDTYMQWSKQGNSISLEKYFPIYVNLFGKNALYPGAVRSLADIYDVVIARS